MDIYIHTHTHIYIYIYNFRFLGGENMIFYTNKAKKSTVEN